MTALQENQRLFSVQHVDAPDVLWKVGQQLKAVHVRHHEIGQGRIVMVLAACFDSLGSAEAACDVDAASCQEPRDDAVQERLVVDEEDAGWSARFRIYKTP